MPRFIERIIGPRVDQAELRRHGLKYGLPGGLLLVARIMLLVSLFLPYWQMDLVAPQYPNNLHLTAFVNQLTGDVEEIDGLNHYIGMRPLNEAAQIERSIGVYAMIAFVVLLELASFIHSRWAVLLVIPVMFFPFVFLIDLHLWMSHFGQNLDPNAPLSNAVEPFVPPVLGTGMVGQFKTVAWPGVGLILSAIASLVMLLALFFHRRAYLPLVKASKKA
ncbi:MAG: cytochrome C [Phycisphaerae bacterium]|nr:cytochrome C [Phycisphaerae bacterium]MBM91437.1 cytochrome C [Phycisphaerae bacterium]MBM92695.1 cytochrome C [Phycisphaerae bacterium]HCT45439.1 cytochrome C [Phycisphaerales bacterium]